MEQEKVADSKTRRAVEQDLDQTPAAPHATSVLLANVRRRDGCRADSGEQRFSSRRAANLRRAIRQRRRSNVSEFAGNEGSRGLFYTVCVCV